jgi:hypothetical protein
MCHYIGNLKIIKNMISNMSEWIHVENHFYTQSNKQHQKNYKITSLYFLVQVYPLHKLLKIMQFSSSYLLNNKLMNTI